METLGGLSGIIFILILVAGVLAFFLPFFILKIRNTIISIDRKMDKVIELLGGTEVKPLSDIRGKPIKYCSSCGAKNRAEDYVCIDCSKPI